MVSAAHTGARQVALMGGMTGTGAGLSGNICTLPRAPRCG
jgi:hypothetical protein